MKNVVVLFVIAVIVTACGRSENVSPQRVSIADWPTPPGTSLSRAEVSEIVQEMPPMQILRIKDIKLLHRYQSSSGVPFIFGGIDGGTPTTSFRDFRVAIKHFEQEGKERNAFITRLPLSEKVDIPMMYQAKLSPEKRRYFFFLPNRDGVLDPYIPAEQREINRPDLGGFSLRLPEGGKAAVTILRNLGPDKVTFYGRLDLDRANAIIEVCQNVVDVNIPRDVQDVVRETFAEVAKAANAPIENILFNLRRLGQELMCNSLGSALTFARSGYDYKTYESLVKPRRLQTVGPIKPLYILLNEEQYSELKRYK